MKRFFVFAGMFAAAAISAAVTDIAAPIVNNEKPNFKIVGKQVAGNTLSTGSDSFKVVASKSNVPVIGLKRFVVKRDKGVAEFTCTVSGKGRIAPAVYFFGEKGKWLTRRIDRAVVLKDNETEMTGVFRIAAPYADGQKISSISPGFYIFAGSEITVSDIKGKYSDHDPSGTITPKAPRKTLVHMNKGLTRTSLNLKKQGKRPAVMFIGDSITYGWTSPSDKKYSGGLDVWNKYFAPAGAVNFGIPGDRVENVLWRITDGNQLACQPKTVVLLVGTNNIGLSPDMPEDIANGIGNLVKVIKEQVPDARVIVSAILPRNSVTPIADINKLLPEVVKANGAEFIDPTDVLTGGTGNAKDRKIFRDGLHLSTEGYRRFASVLLPALGLEEK